MSNTFKIDRGGTEPQAESPNDKGASGGEKRTKPADWWARRNRPCPGFNRHGGVVAAEVSINKPGAFR